MEPTFPYFMLILKIVLIVLFASIPFILGILVNTISKHRKIFLITGKVVSILFTLLILGLFSIPILYDGDYLNIPRLYHVLGSLICGLLTSALPILTFYLTISKKTIKKKIGLFALSFIFFFFILSIFEKFETRALGFAFETERTEVSIDKFYKDNPETDRNSDINLHIFVRNGIEDFTANISMYKDSITLETFELSFIAKDSLKNNRCYRNDLPRDLVQDIIEEITHYQPEFEYSLIADLCLHPSASIILANNQKATAIELELPDLDGFHPKAQRLVKKINDLIKNSKIDPTKGCRS